MSNRKAGNFEQFDFEEFWDSDPYSLKYHEAAPDAAQIAAIEQELGFRLPAAWIELAQRHNGGTVTRSCYPMEEATCWADDHIAITGIFAIGRTACYSLLGEMGWTFMRDEWGYPTWGIGIADTPSGGHEMIMLDYRACGPQGEPSVVHVDQESDYEVTPVAPDFATFIRGLVSEDVYDSSEEDAAHALEAVRKGSLSPIVERALTVCAKELPDGEALLRALGERIVSSKGSFSLHEDPDSWLMYDLCFWLYSQLVPATSFNDYVDMAEDQKDYQRPCHVLMLRISFIKQPYGFSTGGYAEGFVKDWWDTRVKEGNLVLADGCYRFAPSFAKALLTQFRAITSA